MLSLRTRSYGTKNRKPGHILFTLKVYLMKYQTLILLSGLILFNGCVPAGVKEQVNEKFGDQHFKTAIALIELHKIREGSYPKTLSDLKYIGEWDQIDLSSVEYLKLSDTTYQLDLANGWMGIPGKLKYPAPFWKGLGLQKSNLKPETINQE